jgi:hypothetical protein
MVEFRRAENLLNMVAQYEILGFYRLDLNRLNFSEKKFVISYNSESNLVLLPAGTSCQNM